MKAHCKVLAMLPTNKAKTKSNTMKKHFLLALLFGFSTLSWYSCQTDEGADPVIEPTIENEDPWAEKNNSLFWRITGNDLQKPAHLFGTIHLIPENDFSFAPALDSLLDASNSLMLEMDITDPSIIAAAQSRMGYTNGEGPEDYFTTEELEEIKALCTATGISWKSVKHLNLLSLEGYISSQILQREMGVYSGYEDYLVKKAQKNATAINGAEDADYVYSYHAEIPGEEIAARLLKMADLYLNDKEHYLGEYQQMVQIYLAQDLRSLHINAFTEDHTQSYEALIADRNLAWMDALETNMDGKLIAVGAGHLGGKKGLVHLLREKGYEVTALKIAR